MVNIMRRQEKMFQKELTKLRVRVSVCSQSEREDEGGYVSELEGGE